MVENQRPTGGVAWHSFQVAVALIFSPSGLLLVASEFEGSVVWSAPAGRVEQGELYTDALRREVREETGLTVDSVDRLCFVSNVVRTGRDSTVALAFAVTTSGQLSVVNDPDGDVSDARFVPWVDLGNVMSTTRPSMRLPLLRWVAEGKDAPLMWTFLDDLEVHA